MTAALLAPAGLAALLAVAVPLLIHLARRTQQQPTAWAALRWLRPRPRPRRLPRLDELALLAARCALVAVLALVLAHPVLSGAPRAQRWLAVVPGVDAAQARAAAVGGVTARWLAPGFPDLRRPAPAGAVPVASLLRELDADLPPGAGLTVLVLAVLEGADAERPRLSRAVDWRTAPGAMPPPRAADEPTPTLFLRHAPGREGEVRPLQAAAAAWAQPGGAAPFQSGPVSEALPPDAKWIFWSAPGALPEPLLRRVRGGAVLLLSSDVDPAGLTAAAPLWRDAEGGAFVEGGALGRGRWRRFTRPLASEAAPELLDADFASRLHTLLAPPPRPPARVDARAYAPLTGGRAGPPAAQDLRPVLALVAAALFALERWLATWRGRRAAP